MNRPWTISNAYSEKHVLYFFNALVLFCLATSIYSENPFFLIFPLLILGCIFLVLYPKLVYFIFFFLLPFSVEVELPGGFGTDLPIEPIMIVLLGVCTVLILKNLKNIPLNYGLNPISIILFIHLFWMGFSTLASESPFISFKFFLAKIWYIFPFYVLTLYFIKKEADVYKLLKFLLSGVFIALIYVLVRHSSDGFSFSGINPAAAPIFRNHVDYACLLVISLPFLFYFLKYNVSFGLFTKVFAISILLTAIYLSYTRAAIIAVFIIIGTYLLIRFRLIHSVLILSILLTIGGLVYTFSNNNYLDLAPNFERTIAHDKFDNLIEATYKLEDISTMERLYRWVAGVQMVKDHPFLGFGPGTFFTYYKAYTVSSFMTYVSDNPDNSGIHNYYLMTTIEQGILGGLIFIGLMFTCIWYGSNVYHILPVGQAKDIVMSSLLVIVVIGSIIIINDMIESAKVGPFFFLALGLIVKMDLMNRKKSLS